MGTRKLLERHCISARWPVDSHKEQDFFVGKFNDGNYRVFGCRHPDLAYILDDERQSRDDWGKLLLPEGTKYLENIESGTNLAIEHIGLGMVTKLVYLDHKYKLKSSFRQKMDEFLYRIKSFLEKDYE